MVWLAVASGSAFGAVLRYGLILAVARYLGDRWPVGTLLVNVSGALVIALLAGYGWPVQQQPQEWLVAVIASYTTVSGFSLDTLQLWRTARPLAALGNIVLSLTLSLLAVVLVLAILRETA